MFAADESDNDALIGLADRHFDARLDADAEAARPTCLVAPSSRNLFATNSTSELGYSIRRRSGQTFTHADGTICAPNVTSSDGTWIKNRCRRCATCPLCRTAENRAKQKAIVHNLSREDRKCNLMRVVFTIANGPHLKPLIAQLYSQFTKLRDTDRKTTKTIIGGLVKLDCKRAQPDFWGPHFDTILEVRDGVSARQLHRELSARWTGIIARCVKVGQEQIDREKLAGYDCKLSFNGIADDPKLMAEYRAAVGRKPTHFRIGKWRNVKTDPRRWEQLARQNQDGDKPTRQDIVCPVPLPLKTTAPSPAPDRTTAAPASAATTTGTPATTTRIIAPQVTYHGAFDDDDDDVTPDTMPDARQWHQDALEGSG